MGTDVTRRVWVAVTSAQVNLQIRTYRCSILSSVFWTTPDYSRPVLVADVDGLAMQNVTNESQPGYCCADVHGIQIIIYFHFLFLF